MYSWRIQCFWSSDLTGTWCVCVAMYTEDCQPQNQFVSSCSDLITSLGQRVVIMTQGIVVIIGNTGALFIQFAVRKGEAEKSLIISLILADLLMGLYLLSIAGVDLSYRVVFYTIVSEWTSGTACLVIGLVNFISSEVSLLLLSMLAFSRRISIDTVGGMTHMKTKMRNACSSAWAVIMTTGVVYVVYLFTQNMKVRNNICILLGISNQRFVTYVEQAFQIVFIGCNILFLLTMSVSMVFIFHTVTRSYKSAH